MKKYILSFALCLITFLCVSQETYTVNGKSYELKTEVSGTIDLLWNIIDGNYRYFAKKADAIVELTNTKDDNNTYKEEYKTILEGITPEASLSTAKIKLTLESLHDYIDAYNASVDTNYVVSSKAKLLTRFSVFGGISNSPFVNNPDNIKNPLFGVEFEFSEAVELPRHSIYFQGKQSIGSDKFDYSATQIIVGYRFRIINKETFSFYTSIDLAQYVFIKERQQELNDLVDIEPVTIKENGFEAPFTFGFGADIKLSESSFLSITYNELFALLLENAGNFSTSFAVGYKFKL
ncbi:MAG: hypothetical protein DA407_04575 [Bacteroidetes bacterium]|nr:MAG: hypothetical protein DA407_04575 [Bacteroidota bacterium]